MSDLCTNEGFETGGAIIADKIQRISSDLQTISQELQNQIREKHEALLQQASHAGRFETAFTSLFKDVQNIHLAGQRLQTQVDEQYKLLANNTRSLSNHHEILNLLNLCNRLLNHTNNLKKTKDPLLQAEILHELEELIDNKELAKIEFIQSERLYSIACLEKIKNFSQMKLTKGLQDRNMNQVVKALKISVNLNNISLSMENVIKTYISEVEQSIRECFAGSDITITSKQEPEKISANNMELLRNPGKKLLLPTKSFRLKFWKSFHWIIYEQIFECCEQIKFVFRALNEIDNLKTNSKIKRSQTFFWEEVQSLIRQSLTKCSLHVKQILEDDLMKMLNSMHCLEIRLNGEFLFDRDIFCHLEAGYIEKCSANMKSCLAGVTYPSKETVDDFVHTASKELSAALTDSKITAAIASLIVVFGNELCTKLEGQIQFSEDTQQIINIPNSAQIENIAIANILYHYKMLIRHMLLDFEEQLIKISIEAKNKIEDSLQKTNLLINTIIQPIINSILLTIKIILLSIHREPGLDTDKTPKSEPSMYMKELQNFILRSWTNHVLPFDDKEVLKSCGLQLSLHTTELFIHNLSILRPLSVVGRNRLKNDCSFLEQALKPMCTNFSDLGKTARLLRAISVMIVQKPEELAQQVVSEESLVPSYIVLFLLFGHASSELQSPHKSANWSNERFLDWLEGHTSDREKLALISGALQHYRDNIRRKKIEQYDEIYPLILNFFEKASMAI